MKVYVVEMTGPGSDSVYGVYTDKERANQISDTLTGQGVLAVVRTHNLVEQEAFKEITQ